MKKIMSILFMLLSLSLINISCKKDNVTPSTPTVNNPSGSGGNGSGSTTFNCQTDGLGLFTMTKNGVTYGGTMNAVPILNGTLPTAPTFCDYDSTTHNETVYFFQDSMPHSPSTGLNRNNGPIASYIEGSVFNTWSYPMKLPVGISTDSLYSLEIEFMHNVGTIGMFPYGISGYTHDVTTYYFQIDSVRFDTRIMPGDTITYDQWYSQSGYRCYLVAGSYNALMTDGSTINGEIISQLVVDPSK